MNLPVEVIEAVDNGKCILFVGSRFSTEAAEAQGQPAVDAKELAKALGWTKPRQLLGGRAKQARPSVMEGAAAFEQKNGRKALVAEVRRLTDVPQVQPTDFHRSSISRFPLIVTTCQDDLLERTAVAMGGAAQVLYRGDPLPAPDPARRVIYKMNGGFERPETLILTQGDRRELAEDIKKTFRTLVRGHVILFAGYRPDHEEFENVFEDLTACYGGELPRCHLAVAQGQLDDYLWQKWVWRGLLMFTADPSECLAELEARIQKGA